jgi:hypothetical protein
MPVPTGDNCDGDGWDDHAAWEIAAARQETILAP